MNWYLKVLKEYTNFKGRARRTEFWMFTLINTVIYVALMIAERLGIPFLSVIYFLAVLLPTIGVAIRRLHDINRSGWFMLIPLYNIYLFTIDSDPGNNPHGPNPKGV